MCQVMFAMIQSCIYASYPEDISLVTTKEKQLFMKGYSNSAKRTFATMLRQVYPKCCVEATSAFSAGYFGERSSTSVWLDSEVTPSLLKAPVVAHLNQVQEGDLNAEVAVKNKKPKVIHMDDCGHMFIKVIYQLCSPSTGDVMWFGWVTHI